MKFYSKTALAAVATLLAQALLQLAAVPSNLLLYAFQVVLPDGGKRFFQARAFGWPENVGNADAMLTAAPTIEINTPVIKQSGGIPAGALTNDQGGFVMNDDGGYVLLDA